MEGAGAVSYLAQVGRKVPALNTMLFSGNTEGIERPPWAWPLSNPQIALHRSAQGAAGLCTSPTFPIRGQTQEFILRPCW